MKLIQILLVIFLVLFLFPSCSTNKGEKSADGTEIADEIIRRINVNSYRVNRIAIDPLSKADSNEEQTTFQKIATVLMRHDYMLEVASKDKDDGILEFKNW